MRFYIINQAISLLLVSTAFALRGSNVHSHSSKLVLDTDLTGVVDIDIGILSSTAAADVDQYEVDGQTDHLLTASLEDVSPYVSEVEDVKTHGNTRIPSLGMKEGVYCNELFRGCKVCYANYSYYFVGNCCCWDDAASE